MNKKIINHMPLLVYTLPKLWEYCSILHKFDTFSTSDKTQFLVFGVPNAKYYNI